MPKWKGWSEQQVRSYPAKAATSTPQATDEPITTGFTPINADQTTRPKNVGQQSDRPRTRAATKRNEVQRAVSEYLGRRESELTASINYALHGPGTKKAAAHDKAARGKKRPGKAKASTSSKRRISNDVSDNLQITKSEANVCQRSTKETGRNETSDDHEAISRGQGPSTTLYAPPTSISVLNDSSPQTSMSALQALTGQRTTLYRRVEPRGQSETNVSYPEPVINRQGKEQHGTSVKRDLWPRDTGGAQASDQVERDSRLGSADDFMDDEIDEGDIMALADAVEQNRGIASAAGDLQLPIPPTSDALGTSDPPAEQDSEPPPSTSILLEDEDMLHDEYHEIPSDDISTGDEFVREREDSLQSRDRKLNIREVTSDEDYEEALLLEAERQLLAKLKSSSPRDGPKPIVRLPFPRAIRDRSPVFGASSATTLRTCFRIGEALKEGTQAVRSNRNVVLELYARVTHSWQEGRKQHFYFKDLYHDNPPHLIGTFELFSQSRWWDADSVVFLDSKDRGKTCRLIGRMRRVYMSWRLEVLSI